MRVAFSETVKFERELRRLKRRTARAHPDGNTNDIDRVHSEERGERTKEREREEVAGDEQCVFLPSNA